MRFLPLLPLLATPFAALAPQGPGLSRVPDDARSVEVERTRYQMGTWIGSRVTASDRRAAIGASEAVFAEVERLEALLSTWRQGNAMAAFNHAPAGETTHPPAELLELLVEAEGWSRETGRAFDPTVGALVDAWDLRGEGRLPPPGALSEAMRAVGEGAFVLDARAGTARRGHEDAWIDTGSFGKGAALRSGRRILEEHGVGRALLDFGGQLLVVGAGRDGRGERVHIAHPVERERPACRLRVKDASLSTSGASERYVVTRGRRLGHVLDPRSGRPVPDWGSVTVLHADPLVADVLSTALFVMGPEEGLRWALRQGHAVLFLEVREEALVPRWTPAMERWLVDPLHPCDLQTHTLSKEDR